MLTRNEINERVSVFIIIIKSYVATVVPSHHGVQQTRLELLDWFFLSLASISATTFCPGINCQIDAICISWFHFS